ncbi:vacuolar protein sorting-associated protein 73 [Pseudovirgaria hyperparasitica]|uniref:Vacuolar protein sorting-associated protein 73 n=1 Tax=Pseudovirgaria hyperparasitica TaxID=470096 RepID=A0A6A6W7X0_9PEZI|nr:vacuolar protein sorting-associated protein 73 [Pseudovirgaria hyperparasitica]KAF2757677.1 vacuolar protein sorting-associated protein 73 [Pseudovirgaria hyperparasitica]
MDPRTWFKDLTPYFIYLLLFATTGPLLFGFHLAELNAPEDVIRCKAKSATSANLPQCMPMTSAQWGLVGSIYTLGGFLGAVISGTLSSSYGRLRVMQLNTAFFIVGPILQALAPNLTVLGIGRFISGIGAGTAMVVAPLYVSEISPPAERGFFGACTQVMVNVGILIAQLLGFFLSKGQLWRIILAAGGGIGLVQALGLFFGVESPKWTAEYRNVSEAKRNLRRIRGEDYDISEETGGWNTEDSNLTDEHETLLRGEEELSNVAMKAERKENLSIFQIWQYPNHRRAVFAVMMVMVAQQFTGINSIVMYGVGLLSSLLQSNSALLNLVVSALNIIVTAATAPLVDRLGRKVCILNSIFVMGASSLLLAIGIIKSIKILSAVAVLLFVSGFALGLGPVPFILASELVDPEAVGATQSWALSSNWISTFCVAQFFPILNEQLHGKVYLIFTGLAAFFFVFVTWYVPESKGKKTADEVWGRESSARRVD